jgi:hypothetical protein
MHYSYVGFVAQQILGIVGFQIEVERVFNIATICTNLLHSWFGMDNLEMFINIYKHWPNDVHVGDVPSIKKFIEMEETLMNENDDVIASLGLLELDESNINRV